MPETEATSEADKTEMKRSLKPLVTFILFGRNCILILIKSNIESIQRGIGAIVLTISPKLFFAFSALAQRVDEAKPPARMNKGTNMRDWLK